MKSTAIRFSLAVAAVAALGFTADPALARGGPGGGMGAVVGAGMHGGFGGMSGSHISGQGSLNTHLLRSGSA